jgi:hypothetical protein
MRARKGPHRLYARQDSNLWPLEPQAMQRRACCCIAGEFRREWLRNSCPTLAILRHDKMRGIAKELRPSGRRATPIHVSYGRFLRNR